MSTNDRTCEVVKPHLLVSIVLALWRNPHLRRLMPKVPKLKQQARPVQSAPFGAPGAWGINYQMQQQQQQLSNPQDLEREETICKFILKICKIIK